MSSLSVALGANNLFDIYPDNAYIDPHYDQFNLIGDPVVNYTTTRDNTSNDKMSRSLDLMAAMFSRVTFQL